MLTPVGIFAPLPIDDQIVIIDGNTDTEVARVNVRISAAFPNVAVNPATGTVYVQNDLSITVIGTKSLI